MHEVIQHLSGPDKHLRVRRSVRLNASGVSTVVSGRACRRWLVQVVVYGPVLAVNSCCQAVAYGRSLHRVRAGDGAAPAPTNTTSAPVHLVTSRQGR